MASSRYTTILLDRETREELKNMGRKGQTYDQIIQVLIESKKPISRSSHTGTQGHEIKEEDSSASLEHTLESRNS